MPCETVAIVVLSKHTVFFVACDGVAVMYSEEVPVEVEVALVAGRVVGGLLLNCRVVLVEQDLWPHWYTDVQVEGVPRAITQRLTVRLLFITAKTCMVFLPAIVTTVTDY